MQLTSLDHVILPVANLATAAEPFERLGLSLTPAMKHGGAATENRVFFVGNETTEFYVELLGVHDRALAASTPSGADVLGAIDAGAGLYRLMLQTSDLTEALGDLSRAGVRADSREVFRADGSKICDAATVEGTRAGCPISLVQYSEPPAARIAAHGAAGRFAHSFPLLRLDHLAAITPDLDEVTAFWVDTLGVPVFGEVQGRGMLIRQMKVGDAIFELIGPDAPESPVASRPGGLISMAAFEVADLDGAIALARDRGFTLPDAAPGVLPNSRVSTISGDQLSGIALQLIAFG
jgi:catechol 2,3-dioxygenase-like lactoylglutathione lyase family enzyme